jgi:hypothetical protein
MKTRITLNLRCAGRPGVRGASTRPFCCVLAAALVACSSAEDPGSGAEASREPLFATSSIVMSDDGDHTYVSLLPNVDSQVVDLKRAREFAGWANISSNGGRLFVADGESPTMLRYSVSDAGNFSEEGKISFQDYGGTVADSAFVSADKAYVFADDGAIWSPTSMEILDSFSLPEFDNRDGGLEHSGLRTGRGMVVRGNRAFVATNWANWTEYTVAEDSLIVVIDTDKNEIIDQLPVDCPYIDVASLDDDGTVYFSNWVYSVGQTLLDGKRQACAVRILPETDEIDRDWTLKFADVTEGREAAALRALGDGKALLSVFHDEEADLDSNPESLADTANWRFWMLDLATLEAHPVEDIGFNAGGFNTAHLDGRNFVLMPSNDYESTAVYEIFPNGRAEQRWESSGWSTQLLKIR